MGFGGRWPSAQRVYAVRYSRPSLRGEPATVCAAGLDRLGVRNETIIRRTGAESQRANEKGGHVGRPPTTMGRGVVQPDHTIGGRRWAVLQWL
jgi:hypothetical protein